MGNNPVNYIDPTGHVPAKHLDDGGGGGTSSNIIYITVNTFLPFDRVANPDPITSIYPGYAEFSGDGDDRVAGDGGTSRTSHTLIVDIEKRQVLASIRRIGVSHAFDSEGNAFEPQQAAEDTVWYNAGKSKDGSMRVQMSASSGIPYVPWAAKINYEFYLTIKPDGTVTATAAHNGFPGYEVFVNGDMVYSYHPKDAGANPYYLFDAAPWVVDHFSYE